MSLCEKYKNLILTDDLDNEISSTDLYELENHIKSCQACKNLREDAKKILLEPFKDLERFHPPPSVWANIAKELDLYDPNYDTSIVVNSDKIKESLWYRNLQNITNTIFKNITKENLYNLGYLLVKIVILIITFISLYYFIVKSFFVLPVIPKPMIATSSSYFNNFKYDQNFETFLNKKFYNKD